MNEINEKKERVMQANDEIKNLNNDVSSDLAISGDYADYYKKQVDKISTNVNQVNDMMTVAAEVEKKTYALLDLKNEIVLNIQMIDELDKRLQMIQNSVENQAEAQNIQMQIDLLNNKNITIKEQYDVISEEIKNIVSQY